jgi:endonuclease YncB( thermonuclease family)
MVLILYDFIIISMRIIILLLFSISLFAKGTLPQPIKMDNAKALYVIDGDSISLSMRIKGIDTPERDQKCRKTADEILSCGIIAKEYLRILLDNTPGELYIDPVAIDYYGRILVDVYKGGVDIAELMVRDGMAYAYGKKYRQQELAAKQMRKGFWGYEKPPINPKLWRKRYMKKFNR